MSNVIHLARDLEVVLGDDSIIRFHHIDWHIGDWIGGTLGMSLEIEGAYCRLMNRLYQRGKPLPDDDRIMSTVMGLSLRVWKRIKEALVEAGKILIRAGCLTNPRFEKERQKKAEHLRQQASNASARWSKSASSPEVSAKFAPSLPETSSKLSPNLDVETSKNNDLVNATGMPPLPLPLPTVEEITPNGVIPSSATPTDEKPRKPRKPRKAKTPPEEYSKSFTEFWKIYPRKVAKGEASQSWERLSYDQKVRAYRALKAQLTELIARSKDPRDNFCPHPATWINQGRFDDEPSAPTPPAPPGAPSGYGHRPVVVMPDGRELYV